MKAACHFACDSHRFPGRDHSAIASCLMLANTTRVGPPTGGVGGVGGRMRVDEGDWGLAGPLGPGSNPLDGLMAAFGGPWGRTGVATYYSNSSGFD